MVVYSIVRDIHYPQFLSSSCFYISWYCIMIMPIHIPMTHPHLCCGKIHLCENIGLNARRCLHFLAEGITDLLQHRFHGRFPVEVLLPQRLHSDLEPIGASGENSRFPGKKCGFSAMGGLWGSSKKALPSVPSSLWRHCSFTSLLLNADRKWGTRYEKMKLGNSGDSVFAPTWSKFGSEKSVVFFNHHWILEYFFKSHSPGSISVTECLRILLAAFALPRQPIPWKFRGHWGHSSPSPSRAAGIAGSCMDHSSTGSMISSTCEILWVHLP